MAFLMQPNSFNMPTSCCLQVGRYRRPTSSTLTATALLAVAVGGIPDAPADSAIYGRKNNDWVVVPTSGGGDGPDMGLYYTASQCDTKFQPKGSYAAANHSHSNYAAKSHTHSEYQPKGDYLTSFTESRPDCTQPRQEHQHG